MQIKAKIMGVGHSLGENILTNADLEKMVETNNEWIMERTGIEQRRIVSKDTYTSDLAARAAEKALAIAGIAATEIDLIIVATVTPDMITPQVSCMVQTQIGAVNAVAYDINMACSGFVGGLVMAQQFVENGMYRNVLVIGADALSRVTNYQDRKTCILFGDGAGAVVLSANTTDESGMMKATLGAMGSMGDSLTLPFLKKTEDELAKRASDNPHTIWMDGSEVFKFAVRTMADAVKKTLSEAGLTIEDIDCLIPHQANTRIIDGAVKRLKISREKVFVDLAKYGNMSSASIGVALSEAVEQGAVRRGDLVVLVGFGGGLTWGCTVIRW